MQGTCCAPAHTTDCCTDTSEQSEANPGRASKTTGPYVCVPASALQATIVACCCCGGDDTREQNECC